MPDLGKGAEEVAAQLRQLTESLKDTAAFAALEAEVADDTHRAAVRWSETGNLLNASLRPSALDSLESSWQALRSQLEDVRDRIDERARRRAADLETLTKLHESWDRALNLAQKANAPAPVLERAQSTLAAIDAARPPIEQRHAHVLVLQDAVSRALQTCDDARARIDDARRQAIGRIFVRQQPPVWRIGLGSPGPTRDSLGLAGDLAAKIDNVRIYARAYWLRLVLSGLIVLAFVLLLRRGRLQLDGSAGDDGTPGRVPSVVISGDRDRLIGSHAERLASGIPGARLIMLSETGHVPMLERPGTVTEAIAALVAEARRSGPGQPAPRHGARR